MPNTATRLITLIMLLQREPGQKAACLARELHVSVRTIHRYFSMLDEMGIPIYTERGPNGGFSLVRGYRLPPMVFSAEEAAALTLGVNLVGEMWGRLYRDAARAALAKLENVLPDEQRREVTWARQTLFATGMHRSDLEPLFPVLEDLRRACREQLQVKIGYQGGGHSELSTRIIDPYAMVHRWGWWYAIAYCHLRQAIRSFRVDRIQDLWLLETKFCADSSFDLHQFLRTQPAKPALRVRMRFQPGFAQIAHENKLTWENLEVQPDGSVEVEYLSPDLQWAVSMAMGFGPIVEILEPDEARQMIADWSLAVYNRYQREV